MGEEVTAYIRLKDNSKSLTRNEIKEFCKGKISHFKVPRFVIVVDDFPRTVSGKIQKFKFMSMFAEKLEEARKSEK
jgi:fatty-acyl-CoA synthase